MSRLCIAVKIDQIDQIWACAELFKGVHTNTNFIQAKYKPFWSTSSYGGQNVFMTNIKRYDFLMVLFVLAVARNVGPERHGSISVWFCFV